MNFNAQIEIDLDKLKYNIETLKDTYGDYKTIFANVKNRFFGMEYGAINTLVNSRINYLYVSTLNEALEIRKINQTIPILVSYNVESDYIYDAIAANITITISNIKQLKEINNLKLKDKINIHFLIDNGINKIGLKNKDEINEALNIINDNPKINLEGIYTEIMTYGVVDEEYYHAMDNFLKMVKCINKEELIVHLNEPIMYHRKNELVNGIRFDIALIGIEENIDDGFFSNMKMKSIEKKYADLVFPNINLSLIFTFTTKIISVNEALRNTLVGRNYIASENEKIGIIPVGYKDGITKALGNVMINNKLCPIIADEIDYIIIKIYENNKIGDIVQIINEDIDIYNIIASLKTNRYYLMSLLNNKLERKYLNGEESNNVL